MNIGTINYSQICSSYRLTQPIWLKATVLLVAIAALALAGYLMVTLQASIMVIVGLAIVVIIFAFGFIRQLSSGMWNTLLANRQALYIIASEDGKEFIQVPWRYLQEVKLGMHGLNRRGLIICFKSSLLARNELDLMRKCLNVTEENSGQISISVPTGIVNRDKAILELKAYK